MMEKTKPGETGITNAEKTKTGPRNLVTSEVFTICSCLYNERTSTYMNISFKSTTLGCRHPSTVTAGEGGNVLCNCGWTRRLSGFTPAVSDESRMPCISHSSIYNSPQADVQRARKEVSLKGDEALAEERARVRCRVEKARQQAMEALTEVCLVVYYVVQSRGTICFQMLKRDSWIDYSSHLIIDP